MSTTVDPTKFYNKSYEELRNKGDDVTKLVREKMTEVIEKDESLNMAKMLMLLEEMGKNKTGRQDPVGVAECHNLLSRW